MSTRPLLIAAAVLASSGAALAQERPSGVYGEIAGGGNHAREQDFGTGVPLEFETGGLGSISLGYAFGSGWRPEVEYALRRNDAEEQDGNAEANGAMANLWYDWRGLPFAPRLRPYVGGGAGSAEVSLEEFAGSSDDSVEESVAAYQAGAGLNYDATRNLVLSLGYRFFETEKGRFAEATPGTPATPLTPATPGTPALDERYRSDGVLAGLRYVFGRREATPVASAAPAEPADVAAFETVVLRPVNFQLDRAELTAPSKRTLDEVAARLKAHPEMKLTIEGHADETGGAEYNERLGQRRAESVRDYLVSKGVKPQNLQVASAGERVPVADNATAEGRAQNRRTEAKVEDASGERVKIVIEGPTEDSVEAAKERQ